MKVHNMNVFFFFLSQIKPLIPLVHAIKKKGGICYLVGGSVRDLILNRSLKDLDIEVHKIDLQDLEGVLRCFGPVRMVGKQFGVLRLDTLDADWSIPRRDSKGRKPVVHLDPEMSIAEAFRRRDVTMNAMGIDLNDIALRFDHLYTIAVQQDSINFLDHITIVDPFEGLNDLKKGKLRAVDKELFLEDPLRFFRVMQFVGRFEMTPDNQLNEICKTMKLADSQTGQPIARERIFEELKKLLLKSCEPSRGFRWLARIGRLKEVFPSIDDLRGVIQRSDVHPEGDVFEHTMQSLDAAALLKGEFTYEYDQLVVMLGTLCHDFGKVNTTDEELHAYGHEKEGVEVAKKFLKSITDDISLTKGTCALVLHHMKPFAFVRQQAGKQAYKRLALALKPEVSIRHLAAVACADSLGRNAKEPKPLSGPCAQVNEFIEIAQSINVHYAPEPPVLRGRDIADIVTPGPEMGKMLDLAYHIQIDEGIQDPAELKKRIIKMVKN